MRSGALLSVRAFTPAGAFFRNAVGAGGGGGGVRSAFNAGGCAVRRELRTGVAGSLTYKAGGVTETVPGPQAGHRRRHRGWTRRRRRRVRRERNREDPSVARRKILSVATYGTASLQKSTGTLRASSLHSINHPVLLLHAAAPPPAVHERVEHGRRRRCPAPRGATRRPTRGGRRGGGRPQPAAPVTPAGLAQARTRNPRAKLCAFVIVPVPVLRADERRWLAQRVPHLQEQPPIGHLAFDVQQVPRRVDLYTKTLCTVRFRFPFAPPSSCSFHTRPGSCEFPIEPCARCFFAVPRAGGQPGEAPALHRALNPLADGEPAHVHVLAPRRSATRRAPCPPGSSASSETRNSATSRFNGTPCASKRLREARREGCFWLFFNRAHLQGKHAEADLSSSAMCHLREAQRACRIAVPAKVRPSAQKTRVSVRERVGVRRLFAFRVSRR